MADLLTQTLLNASIDTRIADNNANDISEQDVRESMKDIVDTVYGAMAAPGVRVITANDAYVTGDKTVISNAGSTITYDLPASPSDGFRMEFVSTAQDFTIDGNGNTIDGETSQTLAASSAFTMIYSSGLSGYRVVSVNGSYAP